MPMRGLRAWAAAIARAARCPSRDAGGEAVEAGPVERLKRLVAAACRRDRARCRWAWVTRGGLRLAFTRRLWGHLGQWLHAVKLRGEGRSHHLLRG